MKHEYDRNKKFFMCDPDNFDVLWKYDTNAWMDPANKPDQKIALNQWWDLHYACKALAEVEVCPSAKGRPDQVFFANAGLPYKRTMIMSKFYEKPRRLETEPNAQFLSKSFGNSTGIFMPWQADGREHDESYFEGQGDAIWLNEFTLIVGHGIRTNLAGIEWVKNILHANYRSRKNDIRVIPVEMKKQFDFYHLDTCCFWMEKAQTFMIYPEAFTEKGLETLKNLGKVLAVSEEEAKQFVCNSVVVNDDTVFMPWFNEPIRAMVEEAGYRDVRAFPMSEFMKAGGAVKCLLLEHNFHNQT